MSDEAASSGTYFLSYSRTDEVFALRFAKNLRERGISMWVDQLDIRPSEHWDRAIERAVHECRGLVVILSPRSIASDNVADEISYAIDTGKSVLPVMIERCRLPLRITRMQLIDATGEYERALQQCIDALTGTMPTRRRELAEPAPRPLNDPEAIERAKQQLSGVLGPIASIMVDKAAGRSGSVGELYDILAAQIHDGAERERFLKHFGKPAVSVAAAGPAPNVEPSPELSAAAEQLGSTLTPYLGPIASIIARRESANAASAEDLKQRLAAHIPDERERAEFLKRVQG